LIKESQKLIFIDKSTLTLTTFFKIGLWSYGSWIYNNLCSQCLSPLMLWVRISIRARCTTLCDKVCQWLATGQWFSPGPLVSSTNKTDRHDITEILLKVVLNTIKQTSKQANLQNTDMIALNFSQSWPHLPLKKKNLDI
jgi:hypothetical protein